MLLAYVQIRAYLRSLGFHRQGLTGRNHDYVDYDQLRPEDQREYWKWRHKQEERERHEEHKEHAHN